MIVGDQSLTSTYKYLLAPLQLSTRHLNHLSSRQTQVRNARLGNERHLASLAQSPGRHCCAQRRGTSMLSKHCDGGNHCKDFSMILGMATFSLSICAASFRS